jgi:hypothetical protein
MDFDSAEDHACCFPGQWVAISHGKIIAHGSDFSEVADEACKKAADITFERVPDPNAPLWRLPSAAPAPVFRPNVY